MHMDIEFNVLTSGAVLW